MYVQVQVSVCVWYREEERGLLYNTISSGHSDGRLTGHSVQLRADVHRVAAP